jgi:PAS domain S-box-containing protein
MTRRFFHQLSFLLLMLFWLSGQARFVPAQEPSQPATPTPLPLTATASTQTQPAVPPQPTVPPNRLQVVFEDDALPFQFITPDGKPSGFLVEFWRLAGQKAGLEVTFLPLSADKAIPYVLGNPGYFHAGTWSDPQRDTQLDFGEPVWATPVHCFFHESLPGVTSLADLKPYRVGVIEADQTDAALREPLAGLALVPYPNRATLYEAVARGEIRVFVDNTPTALRLLAQKGLLNQFRHPVDQPLITRVLRPALAKNQPGLMAQFNAAVGKVSTEERSQLVSRWMNTAQTSASASLTLLLDRDLAPYSLLDSSSRPIGLSAAFWTLWGTANNRAVAFRTAASPAQILERLKGSEADLYFGPARPGGNTPADIVIGKDLFFAPCHLFSPTGKPLSTEPEALVNQPIAVLRDEACDRWLQRHVPTARRVPFDRIEEAIAATRDGKTRAFATLSAVAENHLARTGLASEFERSDTALCSAGLHLAALPERSDLIAEAERGLQPIPSAKLLQMESRWIADAELRYWRDMPTSLTLTPKETAWLQAHGTVRLGVNAGHAPFEHLSGEDELQGIGGAMVQLMEERTGLRFKVAPLPEADPAELAGQIQTRIVQRRLDAALCLPGGQTLPAEIKATDPYVRLPLVFVTRLDFPVLSGIGTLTGKNVALAQVDNLLDRLLTVEKNLKVTFYKDARTAAEAVAGGQADVFITDRATAGYTVSKVGGANLKIAGETREVEQTLAFAVRADWPELLSILNKTIASMTDSEREEAFSQWVDLRFDVRSTAGGPPLYWLIGAAVLCGLLLLFLFHTLFRLRKIRLKTVLYQRILDQAADTTLILSKDGVCRAVSQAVRLHLGRNSSELQGQRLQIFAEDESAQETLRKALQEAVEHPERTVRFECGFKHKEGLPTNLEGLLINRLKDRTLRGLLLTLRNTVGRRQSEIAARKTESLMQTLFDQNFDAVFLLDLDGKVVNLNHRATELFQIPRSKALGRSLQEDFSAPDAPLDELKKAGRQVAETGCALLDWRALRPADGTVFPVEMALRKIQIDETDLVVASLRDRSGHSTDAPSKPENRPPHPVPPKPTPFRFRLPGQRGV